MFKHKHMESFDTEMAKQGRVNLFQNKWRDYSLPLRQQYLVMSHGARGEGVRSQGGWKWSHLTFTILHPDGWFKAGRRGKKEAGLERRTVGAWGDSDQVSRYDGLGMGKRKKQLILVWLQSMGIKEGRLNEMIHHLGKGISLIEGPVKSKRGEGVDGGGAGRGSDIISRV